MKRLLSIIAICIFAGCVTGAEAPPADKPTEERWQPIVNEFPTVKVAKNILSINIPRADLEVGHIDLGEIPTDAGLSSSIYFFPCPCGKMNAIGQLCVVDYEMNDVIDELRAARIKIASVSPMFIGARPQIMLIRFQGEGDAGKLAQALKKALSWTGDDRNTVK
ncbi:MAG TPA: DUF1259 domain-containing protein [Tepidisphaeraceae bacterium]|jgi:hypothetical protein|nr:DUF1259 domain-containing protein [Tepidisphaeraceae bacterium]